MATTTITDSGAHAAAAATDRIPALKTPFTPGTKGYLTPQLIATYAIGSSNTSLGSNWPTALGAALGSGWAALLAHSRLPPITVNNYSQMTALTVAQGLVEDQIIWVNGGAAKGDGGHGFFRVAAGTTTANGGTLFNHDTLSFSFIRQFDGTYYPEWFGTSSDWGAALTAAFTACASGGGVVKMRPGGDYTFSTQATMPVTESNITWDIRGCKIRPRYASGANFKFGTGASQIQEITILGGATIIDCDSIAGGGVSQPIFEFRGVRAVRMQDVRISQAHQLAIWGDPSDAVRCFNFWIDRCDITMRSTTHTHAILANGGSGGLYFGLGTSIEADARNVTDPVYLIHLTSAQGPLRLDHIVFSGGSIFKGWDRLVSAVDARVVNIDADASCRYDEAQDAAFYIEATSGAAKGGCELIRLAGSMGSNGTDAIGKLLRVKADANLNFRSILLDGTNHDLPGGPSIHITTSGAGVINSVHIKGHHIANADPSSNAQDAIIIDGDIDEALIDDWTIQHKTGSTYNYRYGIYNNTASTKSVRITKNFTMDAYGTGVVYDPNVGDLSINRWCEIRQDGTPRVEHTFTFHYANAAAGLSNALVGVEGAASISSAVTAPARGRVIGNDFALNGTITTDTMTIGLSQSSVISTNFDQAFTSASGANPRAVVDYRAGSTAYAAGDAIELRVTTTAGTFAPTTIDFWANVRFLEM